MAGLGLHAAPPPRPPSHNYFGSGNNPGNQLYVGNVCSPWFLLFDVFIYFFYSCLIRRVGKTLKIFSELRAISFVPISTLAQMVVRRVLELLSLRHRRTRKTQSVGQGVSPLSILTTPLGRYVSWIRLVWAHA
jgi:hypothetical protein